MKKAFTLVEVLIIVAILGILASFAVPLYTERVTEAKEAAAKANLRILRSAIGSYAIQHNDVVPGYPNGNMNNSPDGIITAAQLTSRTNAYGQCGESWANGYIYGPYVPEVPYNPFTGSNLILTGINPFTGRVGDFGWLYVPATRTIKLNWHGEDKNGVPYLDY
jgi:prepilin-type N-terminal cleavage/methylation domain-containing protein